MEFDKTPLCIVEMKDLRLIRIRIVNTKSRTAKGCRVYLTTVKTSDIDGQLSESLALEGLQVPWARKGLEAIDLERGIPRYIDFVQFSRNDKFNFSGETTEFLREKAEDAKFLSCNLSVVSEAGLEGSCKIEVFKGSNAAEFNIKSFHFKGRNGSVIRWISATKRSVLYRYSRVRQL